MGLAKATRRQSRAHGRNQRRTRQARTRNEVKQRNPRTSGNLLSACPKMLAQDPLYRLLECRFHVPLRIFKTAPANCERQFLADSVPAIVFRPETAIFRDI